LGDISLQYSQPVIEWLSIEPLHWSAVAASIACGAIVGFERQIRGKPVGIRTSSLIVLGTYVFIAISHFNANNQVDSSRIIGQVVTGVGFLGAGVMMAREGVVIGVTSAATIWALAAIGTVIPMAGETTAIKLALVVVAILYGVDILEDYSAALTQGVHSRISDWKRRS
jgi:putative Mg2+ transporter-C (MgtC) family protein